MRPSLESTDPRIRWWHGRAGSPHARHNRQEITEALFWWPFSDYNSAVITELNNRIDHVWDAFWSAGVNDSLTVSEQIAQLLIACRLDDVQMLAENKGRVTRTKARPASLASPNRRSCWSLDRSAATTESEWQLESTEFSADQVCFANVIIDDLARHGAMETTGHFESSYADHFVSDAVVAVTTLHYIDQTADPEVIT